MIRSRVNNFDGVKSSQKVTSHKRTNDNIYKTGSLITTKAEPLVRLMIKKYIHRSYYCGIVGDDRNILRKYSEQELNPPSLDL